MGTVPRSPVDRPLTQLLQSTAPPLMAGGGRGGRIRGPERRGPCRGAGCWQQQEQSSPPAVWEGPERWEGGGKMSSLGPPLQMRYLLQKPSSPQVWNEIK